MTHSFTPPAILSATLLCLMLPTPAAAQATDTDTAQQRRQQVMELLQRTETRAETRSEATLPPPAPARYTSRDDVQSFIRGVTERHPELPRTWIEQTLDQAQLLPSVQKLIMPTPAGTIKDWSAYRARFIEPKRIQAGVEFWRANERWLRAAESHWGVPAQIIVGIVGVETFYGRMTGNLRALDALATLAFDFPTGRSDRSPFFRDELENLLLLAHRDRLDPLTLRGSYAGALGWPQFMPGSWLKLGFDFDDDGRVDLINSLPDVIGSIANYLAHHGWQRGMPTHYTITPPSDPVERARLLVSDINPSFTAAELVQAGAVLPPAAQRHKDLMALVRLDNGGQEPTYVAGTQNFWVVTRYNQSSYYALAVIELGQAVTTRMGR